MKRSKRTPIILKEEDISLPKSMLDHAGDPLSKESSEAYSVPGSGSIEAPAAEESLVSHPSSQGHENARGASPSIQQIRILLRCVGAFFPFTIAVPFLFSPNPDIQFLSMSVTVWGVYLCLRLLLPIPLHSIVFAGVSFLFFASIAQILMISFTFLKKYVYQFTFTTWPFLFFAYFVLGEVALFSLFVLSKTTLKRAGLLKRHVPPPPDWTEKLLLVIGEIHHPKNGKRVKYPSLLTIRQEALFANLFVFGSIGSGKTVFLLSALKQLLSFQKQNPELKPGGLFIDEKGNLGIHVQKIAESIGRAEDVYMFDLSGSVIWNPLHEPEISADALARRLKIIMECGIERSADWIRQYATDFLSNTIALIRLTSPHYTATFKDIAVCLHEDDAVIDKLKDLRENKSRIAETLSHLKTDLSGVDFIPYLAEKHESLSAYFFKSWFHHKRHAQEAYGYVTTAVRQLIDPFVDPKVSSVFNPETPNAISFKGFDWMIQEGKLFVYSIPDSIYGGLGRYISLFLKLAFQKTCLARIPKSTPGSVLYQASYNTHRAILFVADENQNSYHPIDNEALDKLREAKIIHICLTQSYVSLLAQHPQNENAIRQYVSNFRNKLFLAADDEKSAKYYSDLCGQELKPNSTDAHLNIKINAQYRLENRFPFSTFLELQSFQGIFFGVDGKKRILPRYVYAKPYFIPWEKDYFSWAGS